MAITVKSFVASIRVPVAIELSVSTATRKPSGSIRKAGNAIISTTSQPARTGFTVTYLTRLATRETKQRDKSYAGVAVKLSSFPQVKMFAPVPHPQRASRVQLQCYAVVA
eukprot:6201863-Pleurochrysis_carterae.AAC.2